MKGKVLGAIGISGLLMAGGVFSASASTSGYDLFKTSVKKTITVNSFTAHVQASVEDNGNTIYKLKSLNKQNMTTDSSSSLTTVNNGKSSSNVALYSGNNQEVVKKGNTDTYYVKQRYHENEHENNKEEKQSPQVQKDLENIFDALTKNVQDSISTKDLTNGNKEIQLELSKNQIPAVAQAVSSFFIKNINGHSGHMDKGEFGQFTDLQPNLPQLASNITITRANLSGEINKDQYLVGQKAVINVSGDDAKGTHHELVLHLANQLDGLNSTKVDSINLKGKKIVKVQEKRDHHED